MGWADVTKKDSPHLSNTIFPPDEHALYKSNFATGNGELYKVVADMKTAAEDCFYAVVR